jgi:hypothetical protein
VWSVGAHAEDISVDRIEIVSKGVYLVETGKETPDAAAPTGEIAAPVTFKNIEATDKVAAKVGTEFGLEYRVVGAPDGTDIDLEFVITYPAPGLNDPAEAEPIRATRFDRVKTIGKVEYLGYGLENDWELAPGTWTFRIWYKDRKLAEESFTVTE